MFLRKKAGFIWLAYKISTHMKLWAGLWIAQWERGWWWTLCVALIKINVLQPGWFTIQIAAANIALLRIVPCWRAMASKVQWAAKAIATSRSTALTRQWRVSGTRWRMNQCIMCSWKRGSKPRLGSLIILRSFTIWFDHMKNSIIWHPESSPKRMKNMMH